MAKPDHREVEQPVGLSRRLGAMFYDSLLLFSVLIVATGAALAFTDGETIRPGNYWFSSYLLSIAYFYFAWPWVHGGQTLGMKTWHVCLQSSDGRPVGWPAALARFIFAIGSLLPLGLGFFWSAIDHDGSAWHDRLSGTRLCLLSPTPSD